MIRLRPVGAEALLLEVDDPAGWFAELWHRREAGELEAAEIVPGARTVLLDGLVDQAGVGALVRRWARSRPGPAVDAAATGGLAEALRWAETPRGPGSASRGRGRTIADELVRIPVRFDGQDLGDVAARWDTDERGVVDRLCEIELRVAFCGFTPGWAYLTGLPTQFAVPRLQTPRPRVLAGSVALADAYAGIYPTSSPGGWRLVGRTDVRLFDPERDPPALLTPGRRVRFVEVRGQ